MDITKKLKGNSYSHPRDITYSEIDRGRHDLPT
jgi:hypothetical protein